MLQKEVAWAVTLLQTDKDKQVKRMDWRSGEHKKAPIFRSELFASCMVPKKRLGASQISSQYVYWANFLRLCFARRISDHFDSSGASWRSLPEDTPKASAIRGLIICNDFIPYPEVVAQIFHALKNKLFGFFV